MLNYFTRDLCITVEKKNLDYFMRSHLYYDIFDTITLNGLLRRPGVLLVYVCVYASSFFFNTPPSLH